MSAEMKMQIAAFFTMKINASKKCALQNLATSNTACQFRGRPLEATGFVKTTEEEQA